MVHLDTRIIRSNMNNFNQVNNNTSSTINTIPPLDLLLIRKSNNVVDEQQMLNELVEKKNELERKKNELDRQIDDMRRNLKKR